MPIINICVSPESEADNYSVIYQAFKKNLNIILFTES